MPDDRPAAGRIAAYDVARFLAICGMVVVNFTIVMGTSEAGPGWLVWLAGLVTGRAAATFVILAGIGVSLLSRRARESGDPAALRRCRAVLWKRAVFLLVVGLVYYPLWPGDILHYYGVYIALAAVLLTASGRLLWGLAVVFAAVFVVLLATLDYSAGWRWETLTYLDFRTPAGFVRNLFFNGFHPVFPWLAFLLVGMWLGRRDLRQAAVRRRVLVAGLVSVVVAELLSWLLIRQLVPAGSDSDLRYVLGTGSMPPMPLYLLSAGGTAVVVIALTVAFLERFPGRRWIEPFVATGQLALTMYFAHVVLGLGLLLALGLIRGQSLAFSLACALAFCAVAVVFSWWWRRHFRRGPLEWVMRRVAGG